MTHSTIPAKAALEVELDKLATLCSSLNLHGMDELAGDLLVPIATVLGAESAACRHLGLQQSRPEILKLASIGVGPAVAEDYLSHFHRFDPFLDSLSYSAPIPVSDNSRRYYHGFLRPNGLIHHTGFVITDPAQRQMWVFNFHRPASVPDFSSLDLARSRVIEACLHGQARQAAQKAGDPILALNVLTAREHIVVKAVARGLANKQVAAELGISPRTVENHLRNIYDKLKINTRTQLLSLLH